MVYIENNFRWDSCPLCSSNQIYAVGNIDYRTPVMFSTIAIELERVPELYICEICDSWFTQNIICKDSAFDMYCSGQSCDKWPRSVELVEEKSANILRRLDHSFYEGQKVLDIGCNTGVLLDYARAKGCITAGVEPSLASRNVLSSKGHAAFYSIESVTEKYNVITAFDLVEHLYDLPGFFKIAGNLLASDGVVLILTGDILCLSARLSRVHWWYLKAPEHIVFPSRDFFKSIAGFEIVSIDNTYASISYNRALLLGIAQYIRKSLFFRPYVGLPSLGPDHMLVALRKAEEL